MIRFKKMMWFALGITCLGIAYVGLVTPGIPWSTPTVAAAFCFARSNRRWHAWMINHPVFGDFLTNWSEQRVFPRRAKWMMVLMMDISLITIYVTTGSIWLTVTVGVIMLITSVWAWRYPSTVAEAHTRRRDGQPLGWFS